MDTEASLHSSTDCSYCSFASNIALSCLEKIRTYWGPTWAEHRLKDQWHLCARGGWWMKAMWWGSQSAEILRIMITLAWVGWSLKGRDGGVTIFKHLFYSWQAATHQPIWSVGLSRDIWNHVWAIYSSHWAKLISTFSSLFKHLFMICFTAPRKVNTFTKTISTY